MSSSTVNMVKYFFHKQHKVTQPKMQQYVALAYQAARDQQLYPSEVFIRYAQGALHSRRVILLGSMADNRIGATFIPPRPNMVELLRMRHT